MHNTQIHDRKTAIDQAILAGLMGLFLLSPSLRADESKKETLRFGDPESLLYQEVEADEEEGEEGPVKPKKVKSPSSPRPEHVAKPGKKKVDVRGIISSVKPGEEYSQEFQKLLQLGRTAVPDLTNVYLDTSYPWESRWMAAMALGAIGGDGVATSLRKGLKDSLFLIRMASARSAGKLNDAKLAPALRDAIDDKAMVVRVAVVEALASMKDGGSVPILAQELKAKRNYHRGKSLWIRPRIIQAFGEIGEKKAVPILIEALSDRSPKVRKKACSSLKRLVPEADPAKSKKKNKDCAEAWLAWNQSKT